MHIKDRRNLLRLIIERVIDENVLLNYRILIFSYFIFFQKITNNISIFFILIKISLVIQRIKNPKNVYFIYCIIILSYIKYQSVKRIIKE